MTLSLKPAILHICKFSRLIFILLFGLIFSSGAIVWHVRNNAKGKIYLDVDSVPPGKIAIIFGASYSKGELSHVLKDRVQTGVDLYRKGKVKKLLMTGDNRSLNYNEPAAMKKYAMACGVPESDIVLDYAGRHTYDSCYRASTIFGIDSATLITQSYHLPRALYIANALGIRATGVRAERRNYRAQAYYNLREVPASITNWIKVHITKPKPVLGKKISISFDIASQDASAEDADLYRASVHVPESKP